MPSSLQIAPPMQPPISSVGPMMPIGMPRPLTVALSMITGPFALIAQPVLAQSSMVDAKMAVVGLDGATLLDAPSGKGVAQLAAGIQGAHDAEIARQRFRQAQRICLPEPRDAGGGFSPARGKPAIECVAACAGMRVHIPETLVLDGEIIEQLYQYQVFKHIGVIAGVKAMTVAQHGEVSRVSVATARAAWVCFGSVTRNRSVNICELNAEGAAVYHASRISDVHMRSGEI